MIFMYTMMKVKIHFNVLLNVMVYGIIMKKIIV